MYNVSIVIPAYNEENRLPSTLEKIKSFLLTHKDINAEVIVVNDGSTDLTQKVVAASKAVTKIINLPRNYGKGFALRSGVAHAKYDLVYLCDADLSAPIDELPKFLKNSEDYDCVIGSRALKDSHVKTSIIRRLLGRMGNLLISILLHLNINDTQCGFKLLNEKSKELFVKCSNDRWSYDFEFLYFLRRNRLKILEIPIVWVGTKDSRVKLSSYFRTLRDLLNIWWKYRVQKNVPMLAEE